MSDKLQAMADEIERRKSEGSGFDPLFDVTQILGAIPDRTRFLETLLTTARRYFLADHSAILSFHRPTKRWFLEAQQGLDEEAIEEIKGLSWTVIREATICDDGLLIKDAPTHSLTKESRSIRVHNVLSVLCTPIHDSVGLWGVIYLDNCNVPNAFGSNSRRQLRRFAEFAGMAIQRCEDIVRLSHPLAGSPPGATDEAYFDFANPMMAERMGLLRKAVGADVPILLTGETGTGKDILARWLHDSSPRMQEPFVQINCPSIPPTLVESELFGIESRAASGVDFHEGKIKLADGGTVFLNEIGELPLSIQAKILRVIEEKVLDRVGGATPVGIDVRFICATNRDLKSMVEEGTFRRDLYFRINVFETEIPRLRDRPEDIPLLADHILAMKCRQYRRGPMRIPKTVMAQLISLPWKGNVRELANVLERGVILLEGDEFVLEALDPSEHAAQGPRIPKRRNTSLPEILASVERQSILASLRETGWMMRVAASRLGVPVSSLRSKMKRLGIKKPKRLR